MLSLHARILEVIAQLEDCFSTESLLSSYSMSRYRHRLCMLYVVMYTVSKTSISNAP